MHDISKHPYWTHDEFMAYLLFYAANADMECTDEERKMILDTIPEGHLPEVESEYNRLSDFERLKVIQLYKTNHYPSSQQKEELIEAVKKLCNADGEYDIMERNMVMMLGRLL
jgi:uncharacterized tellurite resistance protein B-like protein